MKTDETMVDVVPWFVFRGIAFGHKIIPGTWGTRYIESVPGIRKQLVETFNMAVQEYVCRREMSGRLVFFWKRSAIHFAKLVEEGIKAIWID